MKCDIILSLVFYFCGCFYMVYGAVIIAIDAKSKVSRLFLLIASSLAIWSFSCSISNSAPTAQVSAFWRSFSAFGWGVFSSLLLHFLLVLTKTESRLNKRAMFVILYLPALINIILFGPYGLLVEKQYQMAQTDFGWVNMAPMYAERIWLNLYYIIFSIASIIVLFQWWKKTESYPPREKRQIKRFIVSILFVFLIETVIDVLPDILGKKYHPQLPVVSLLIPTIMIFPLLKKTVRFERKNIIHPFLGTEKDLDGDRVRLFNTVTVIFMLGSALSFLIGYFGMNRNLGNELLLAAFLLLMGMVVKCIPLITKNQTAQNSIFLIISISCLLYFIIKHAGTGGLTVWAIYILVLLFTVVLGSSHAYVITAISVVVQIVFWIILPEVSVTININEYVARIFIIVLSFVAVQYLINEFTAKIRGYQRFAREQEVLEKISSSFISVNSKNVREKINEMFEMAVEILEFNHAYITGFGQDYKDATIVNMYMKDVDRESFPYYPGMRFSTAELPMFKFLIEQNEPIVCEDTANISFDKDGLHRDYFMSRGVKSFLAIPITIDNKTGGIFFIEYRDRIDGRLAESRLNFLKIIANILGDARNKALYEERLYHSAYFDEATKLANRNMLKIRLEQIIRNRIELEKIAVLNIEIENLRMINDTFGHEVGEQVMIESAAILEKQLEGCYDISRAGEGDFVVVLSEVKCHEQIMECAEKLLASFSHPILTETGVEALYVVVHIGISVYPDDGRDADTLLKNADLAGYEARNNNEKIVFYTKRLENYIIENTLLTNRLFKALKNEEFFLEFQPQINCSTGKTAGVEALLRWTSDGNKRIPPERFIPILEQTGLIYDIGLWVLEQALQQHNKLIERGFPPLRISVNLSVVQFQGENIIRDFRKIIEESGVNPKYIDLEITESWISNHSDDIIGKLRKLKELGVNIAIDDFGKGYSSLHRLKFVPFDRIKIDKDIIQNLDFEGKKASIAEIIVLLARAFNAVITAEGVETKEQADFLKSVACDEIQGYYFSRPLSTKALEEFLKKEYRLAD